MTGKEHFNAIINQKSDHCGFWHGCPWLKKDELYNHFGVKNDLGLGIKLGSVCHRVYPEAEGLWNNPAYPMFDAWGGKERTSLSEPGYFVDKP